MIINFRQGIIQHSNDGSVQTFLEKNVNNVDLLVPNGPTLVSVSHLNENYTIVENVSILSAWSSIDTGTPTWLYWDINLGTGIRTFGSTIIEPTYGTTFPSSPVEDQHFFNTNDTQMYVYISGGWRTKIRVFAAKIWGSTFSPLGFNGSTLSYNGSQVQINIESNTGTILFDENTQPLKRTNGTFVTTEQKIFSNGSQINVLRLESTTIPVISEQNISKFSVVKFSNFGKISLTTALDTSPIIAISLNDMLVGYPGTVCIQGIVENSDWNFHTIGQELFIDDIPGYLTPTNHHIGNPNHIPVAKVLSPNSIVFGQTNSSGIGISTGSGGGGSSGPIALDDLTDVIITTPINNQLLKYDGTNWINSVVNSVNQNITLSGDITGSGTTSISVTLNTVPISKGGTGQITANLSLNALLPSQSGNNTKFLTTDGTNASWNLISLSSLSNVSLTSPTTGQILQYNGTNWINVTDNDSLSTLTDTIITTPLDGDLLQFIGTNWINLPIQFNTLTDANITNPIIGDTLKYDGTFFANVPFIMSSLFDVNITNTYYHLLTSRFIGWDTASSKWTDITIWTVPSPAGNADTFLTVDSLNNIVWTHRTEILNNVSLTSPSTNQILQYDGTNWINVNNPIPSQTGNSGKFLTTNGTTTSWATVSGGGGGSLTGYTSTTNTGLGIDNMVDTGGANSCTSIGYQSAKFGSTGATNNVSIGVQSALNNQIGTRNISIGDGSNYGNLGSDNIAIGHTALMANGATVQHFDNIAIGTNALITNEADGNVAIGSNSLSSNVVGLRNTSIGTNSLLLADNIDNTMIGFEAGKNHTGNFSTAIGSSTLQAGSIGYHVAIGYQALKSSTGLAAGNVAIGSTAATLLTTGSANVMVGESAGTKITTGSYNTILGSNALYNATTISEIIAIGYRALYSGTTCTACTAIGTRSLELNSTGTNNTGIGYYALSKVSNGTFNTGIGSNCLFSITTATLNTAIGFNAGKLTTGSSNTIIGAQAFATANSSANNVAIGYQAFTAATGSVTLGTAIGYRSLFSNTSGSANTAVGDSSMLSNSVGIQNVAVGSSALAGGTNAGQCVGIGFEAGKTNTTGLRNTSVGFRAMFSSDLLSDNTAVGYLALTSTSFTNTTGLGSNSIVTAANQVQLGDLNTITYVFGTVQNRSDKRDKNEIRDTILGLDFINKLRPVDYKWNYRDDYKIKNEYGEIVEILENNGSKTRNRFHHGLIAQEVQQIIEETGTDFGGFQNHSLSGGNDVMSIGYDEFIGPLIKAIQELTARIKILENR